MKFFEIIFILLLMIPVALLMRLLVSKLSAEMPKQVKKPHDSDEVSVRALRNKSKKKKAAKKRKESLKPQPPAEKKPEETDFIPRKPVQKRRSEKVSFSEIYGDDRPKKKRESETGRRITPRKPMVTGPVREYPKPPEKKDIAEPAKPKKSGLFSRKTVLLNTEEIRSKIATSGKTQSRSETEPTKRQKRKQRERSRKRKMNRSKKER